MAIQHRGFTMVEVLVALLILSVGLLGIASMQTLSVQMNVSAKQSSQATYLAYDIIERMRANRRAALAGDYNHDSEGCTSIPTGNGVVATDLRHWLNSLCGMSDGTDRAPPLLPQDADAGSGASVAVASGMATVTVAWIDERWVRTADERLRTVAIQVEL